MKKCIKYSYAMYRKSRTGMLNHYTSCDGMNIAHPIYMRHDGQKIVPPFFFIVLCTEDYHLSLCNVDVLNKLVN